MDAGPPLAAVAQRAAVPLDLARRLDDAGLLARDGDGSLGAAASRRLFLVGFALQRGIDPDELVAALGRHGDLLAGLEELAAPPATSAEVEAALAELDLPAGLLDEVVETVGMRAGEAVTREDLQALRTARRALDLGLPPDALLQLLRVLVDCLDRLAESQARIVHDTVHAALGAQGLRGPELLAASAGVGSRLSELVEPTLLHVHRRAWARAARWDVLRHLTEDDRPPPGTPGASACTVMFADLSGFTPLTAAMGDDAAAQVLSRFGAAVRRTVVAGDGRVVKQIGDAFMLVFDRPRAAVDAGVALLRWCAREPSFPPVHIGAHSGDVLFRDGDYVGATVNLAARVASATEPMQFLVTDAVAAALDADGGRDAEVVTTPQPTRTLKGVPEAVALVSVAPAEPLEAPAAVDPVCGMSLTSPTGPVERRHGLRTWRFCSPACAARFDADPGRYLPA